MAWYNKINPFTKTDAKQLGIADAPFNAYSIGGQLVNTSPGDYVNAYGQVGWVFACVSRIASAVAETNWRLYQVKNDKQREEIISNPVLDLFDFVNEYNTGMEMMEQTQTYIDLLGEAFWMVIKDRANRPSEIWVINPNKIKVVPSKKDYIAGYVYVNGQDQIPLEKSDVIHIKLPNPNNPYRGLSPIASIMSDIEAEKFSSEYNKSFFQNSAEPSGVINFEGTLTDSQYERLRYQWNQQHQGVSRSHKVAILEGGATWQGKTVNQKDMQFRDLRLMNRDVILGAYGMPLHILGISESVNRANAEASEYTFARWVVRPRLNRIKAKINEQFIPMFGKDLVMDFDTPVPEDIQRNLSVADTGFKSGYITRNEARQFVGLDSVTNGDVFMLPLASTPESVTRQKEFEDEINKYKLKRWKAFEDKYNRFQAGFKKVIAKVLEEQRDEVIKNLGQVNDDQVFDENASLEQLQKTLRILYEESIKRGGEDTRREIVDRANQLIQRGIKQGGKFDFQFDFATPEVDAFIVRNNLNRAKYMTETTRKALAAKIVEGRNQGMGMSELADSVRGMIQWKPERAERIARTETLKALNFANLESARQSKVVAQKEWMTELSGARQSHILMNGTKVALDEQFIVDGDSMMAPGQGADPAQNINCRCTIIEIIDLDAVENETEGRSVEAVHLETKTIEPLKENKEYDYPLIEARCPNCDKLLAKKLLGTVDLYCNRCKEEIKFTDKETAKK
jgi:HK97 family phage portal protein